MRTAREVETPYPCSAVITSRMWRCSAQVAAMRAARTGPMPGTSVSLRASASMTANVPSPKRSTMRPAFTGPMPLTRPLPRYFFMPCTVAGRAVRYSRAWNCQPCFGSLRHQPRATMASPGCRSASVPTSVTSRSRSPARATSASAPARSGARRATV